MLVFLLWQAQIWGVNDCRIKFILVTLWPHSSASQWMYCLMQQEKPYDQSVAPGCCGPLYHSAAPTSDEPSCLCSIIQVMQHATVLQSLTWFTVMLWVKSTRSAASSQSGSMCVFSPRCWCRAALTWFDWMVDAYQWSVRLSASCSQHQFLTSKQFFFAVHSSQWNVFIIHNDFI